jgi:hypothetical protein
MTTATIKLTAAQRSALECAGLDWQDETDGLVLRAWSGRSLRFEVAGAEDLASALNELSNSEDASAEYWRERSEARLAKSAAGASMALANLSFAVRKAAA